MCPSAGFNGVDIIGLGARTPVGLVADAAAAAVRGALSAIARHPRFVDKAGEPMMVARDALLPVEVSGCDRYLALAQSPFSDAVRPLVARGAHRGVIPTFVGLPENRPGRPVGLEQALADGLRNAGRQLGLSLDIETVARGHSAGLIAFDVAVARIRSGTVDVCLVGGVDSYIDGPTLEWLDASKQLMSGVNRSGFPPGEAAGFCLLASSTFACRASLESLASVVSVCTTFEPKRIKTDTICIGEGLSAAIRGVCAPLDPAKGRIEQTWCDLNGERYRSTEYTYAVLRTERLFVKTNVSHPADCWGDVGAASGPLFACLAAGSWSRGYAKGPRALLWASSEGGDRGAALLRSPDVDAGPSR